MAGLKLYSLANSGRDFAGEDQHKDEPEKSEARNPFLLVKVRLPQ
jgi:hypothetical protein